MKKPIRLFLKLVFCLGSKRTLGFDINHEIKQKPKFPKQSSMGICIYLLVGGMAFTTSLAKTNQENNTLVSSVLPIQNDAAESKNPWVNQQLYHRWGLNWFSMQAGEPIPNGAVLGGVQPQPLERLYVCRGFYNGGMHPGKLYREHCCIGWGGDEIALKHYQVLISHRSLHWVRSGYGALPRLDVPGGYQQDGVLYICRAKYSGSWHPGKIVNGNCNIGWGGKEIPSPIYDVLTR